MAYSIPTARITAAVVGTALLMSMLPFVASANVVGGGAFCHNLEQLEENALSMLEQRAGKAQTRNQERKQNYDNTTAERLQNLEQKRLEADAARDGAYENLKLHARTQEQTQAVEAFEEAVEMLVRERRASVDDAIESFEGNTAEMYDEFSVESDEYVEDIQVAVIAAFDAAEDGCNGSASNVEVRNELRDTLQAVRNEYNARREGYNYRERLQEMRQVRTEVVEAAMSQFREAYEAEKERLRQAFGE
jgi:hypothetical protein